MGRKNQEEALAPGLGYFQRKWILQAQSQPATSWLLEPPALTCENHLKNFDFILVQVRKED